MKLSRVTIFVVACIAVLTVATLWPVGMEGKLVVGAQKFSVEVVKDVASQQKGLSGRESLGKTAAMVFSFERPDVRCFWMKDMKFPLDIVWLDAHKRVNAIERNLQPGSYPASYCHVDAQYVVEFNAGTAERLNMYLGEQLRF